MDDNIVSSCVFNMVMTNTSNRHIKIHSNQTMQMFCSCEDSQICTLQEIVMFDQNPRDGMDGKSDPDPTKGNLYYVPTRNLRTGRLEVNTLPKKDFYPVPKHEVRPQHNYVHYRKPSLLDAPVNKQTKHNLERLLEENHDAFAEDERQIGTTPLIKMSSDTGDHLPIAKKHMLWPSSWSAPIVVVPQGDGGKRLCMDFRALNAIMRTYVWSMPLVEDIFAKLGTVKFFTNLYLRSGFHHIALDDDAIKKTAFIMSFGKYEYIPKGHIWPSSGICVFLKSYEQGSKWTAFYLGLLR